jgi:stress-induced morphogen
MPCDAASLIEMIKSSTLQPMHVVRQSCLRACVHPRVTNLCLLAQEVTDTSDGCGSKFEAIVVSAAFDGMGL